MMKRKTERDPIIGICLQLVKTHNERIESIKIMAQEQNDLRNKIKGITITDMPMAPHSGVSDPTSGTVARISDLDEWIKDEQHRVDVVAYAIDRLGFFEPDIEIRNKIRKSILENIRQGGYKMPYEHLIDYPEKYDRTAFYAQRKAFLQGIAKDLHLLLKT